MRRGVLFRIVRIVGLRLNVHPGHRRSADLGRDPPLLPCFADLFRLCATISDNVLLLLCVRQLPHLRPNVTRSTSVLLPRRPPPYNFETRRWHEELVEDNLAGPEGREFTGIVFAATPSVVDLTFVGVLKIGSRPARYVKCRDRNGWYIFRASDRDAQPSPRNFVDANDKVWTIDPLVCDGAALRGSRLLSKCST